MKKKRLMALLLAVLLLTFALSGCNGGDQSNSSNGEGDDKPQADMVEQKVTLYYGDEQGQYVVPVERTLTWAKDASEADKYKAAIEALKEKPEDQSLYVTLPEGATLIDVNVKDDTVYVDFNKDIIQAGNWGSAAETLVVAAIVNTLTGFEGVNQVVLTIDGEAFSLGHMVCDKPLTRQEDMILKK